MVETDSDDSSQHRKELQKEGDDNINRFYHLLEPKPLRQYVEHEYDIVDLSW